MGLLKSNIKEKNISIYYKNIWNLGIILISKVKIPIQKVDKRGINKPFTIMSNYGLYLTGVDPYHMW